MIPSNITRTRFSSKMSKRGLSHARRMWELSSEGSLQDIQRYLMIEGIKQAPSSKNRCFHPKQRFCFLLPILHLIRHLNRFFATLNSAGPSATMKIAGRMKPTSGSTILTGALSAMALTHCRCRSRTLSAWMLRVLLRFEPRRSAWMMEVTKRDTSCTPQR